MTKSISKLARFVDSQISIEISEPWEFKDEVGSSTFTGTISDIYVSTHLRKSSEKETECLIIHLARPFGYAKLKTEYLMGSPRHEGNGLSKLAKGEVIAFNFCRASSERVQSDNPFDSTRWKDDRSFGLIGTIKLENH
ncbi:MAG: hypothetical protein JRE65_01320 [Deltaproteobacteria bacterium]|jgi:hypothetical protein|nr:hypothetical protein [Deltaproteobacteria bacterium]